MKKGFTLMELSIVLVIMGIIVAGIIVGASLINSAKLQGLIKEVTAIRQASDLFKDKYGYWPGDCADASGRWIGASNGDGDNAIESAGNENTLFWYHLHLSGVTTTLITTAGAVMSGSNNPAIDSYPTAQFQAGSASISSVTKNYIEAYDTSLTAGKFLDGKDMYYIDQKIDDGIPEYGDIRAQGADCFSGSSSSSSYEFSTTDLCYPRLYFNTN